MIIYSIRMALTDAFQTNNKLKLILWKSRKEEKDFLRKVFRIRFERKIDDECIEICRLKR